MSKSQTCSCGASDGLGVADMRGGSCEVGYSCVCESWSACQRSIDPCECTTYLTWSRLCKSEQPICKSEQKFVRVHDLLGESYVNEF
jgi:hypothetical protein